MISWYPRFDTTTVRHRLETLGESWDEERYAAAVRDYNHARRRTAILRIMGFSLFAWMTGSLLVNTTSQGSEQAQAQFFWSGAAVLLAAAATVMLIARIPVGAARWRFFRYIGNAIKLLREADRDQSLEVDILPVLNQLGAAARALFLALQGSRRSWRSPPMVADRALRLASPLIDIDIPDDLHLPGKIAGASRESFHRFLHDVAAVVAFGREDLIPRVRQAYPALPSRSGGDTDAPDRDATYLNPMRGRSRWEVAKDFWYPLAPWLSLVVAAAAFVVSVTR